MLLTCGVGEDTGKPVLKVTVKKHHSAQTPVVLFSLFPSWGSFQKQKGLTVY